MGVGEGNVVGHSTIRCWRGQHIGTYNTEHCSVEEGRVLGHSTKKGVGRQHIGTYNTCGCWRGKCTGTFNNKVLEKAAYWDLQY